MSLFTVNEQTCSRDGMCAAVCPLGIIDFSPGTVPVPAADAEELCIVCGHCAAVCPTASFQHRDMPLVSLKPVEAGLRLSPEQCEQFLRGRRSIRRYRDKPVAEESLEQLIRLARYAPSGHNTQGARWLVLSDRDELASLAAIVVDWMRHVQRHMPEVSQTLHLDRAIARWQEGEDVILRDAPSLVIAYAQKDNRTAPATCTIALTYLELAAPVLGLGCCWAGYFQAAAATFPPMAEALRLPEGQQSFGAMMVGYPKYQYRRLPARREPHITWRP